MKTELLVTAGQLYCGEYVPVLSVLFGTDPNRRFSELIRGVSGVVVERDDPSLLRGQYRIVLLCKQP